MRDDDRLALGAGGEAGEVPRDRPLGLRLKKIISKGTQKSTTQRRRKEAQESFCEMW